MGQAERHHIILVGSCMHTTTDRQHGFESNGRAFGAEITGVGKH